MRSMVGPLLAKLDVLKLAMAQEGRDEKEASERFQARTKCTRLIDPSPAHPSAYAPLCSMPNSVVLQLHPMLSLQAQDELESTYDALLASLEAVEVRSAALSK